jgi:DNA-binding CsgD family transcriptional regulator
MKAMTVDQIAKLTDNHRAYLRLVLAHRSSKEIAQAFGISAHTVDKRIKEAMRILGVSSRIEAARILASSEQDLPDRGLGPQAPDLAETTEFQPSLVPGDKGNGIGTTASAITLREDLAGYGNSHREDRGLPLPFPTRVRPENNLSILQRAGWMIGLIIGLALATGILLSGLTALSTLLITLNR